MKKKYEHPTARPECFTKCNVVKCIEGCDKRKLLLCCTLLPQFSLHFNWGPHRKELKMRVSERQKNNRFYLIVLFFISSFVIAEEQLQVHVGNFALPASQQPGPLVGFGQNIIDKGDLQLFLYLDQLKGKHKNFSEAAPSLLYGITDKLSLFVEQSVATRFQYGSFESHGVEDLIAQLEGAIYERDALYTLTQVTLVGNIGFPVGSATKVPPTGFGAVSFFLGFTANHMRTDWYCFTAMAGVIPTSHHQTKFGKEFLYQFGISKNIAYKADKWIFNWMVELDGLYRQRNKILGIIDLNSGGNFILLGPSLWFSTQHLILQGGISAVISEHLFGNQFKDKYYAAFNIGWKF